MRKIVAVSLLVAVAAGALAFAGCGSSSSSETPKKAFEKFTASARGKDYQTIYDMLSSENKKQLSLDDVKSGLTPPPEITIMETKTTGNTGYVRYKIVGDNSGAIYMVAMVKEGGVWKVGKSTVETPESSPSPGSSQSSPPGSAPGQ